MPLNTVLRRFFRTRRPGVHQATRRAGVPARRTTSGMVAAALFVSTAGVVIAIPAIIRTSPADAAALSCTAGTIYNLGNDSRLYSLDPRTGVNTQLVQLESDGRTSYNGLGINQDGTFAYFIGGPNASTTTIYKYNLTDNTQQTFTGPATTQQLVGGGYNPKTGIYYYEGRNGNAPNTLSIFAFDANTNAVIGQVGTVAPPSTTNGSGDIAFDALGNLYVLTASAANGQQNALLRVNVADLPTTAGTGPIPATKVSDMPNNLGTGVNLNGVAFTADGLLYAQYSQNTNAASLLQVNPNSGALSNTISQSGQADPPASPVGDLASCAFPGTITAQKNIVSRANPGDQFTVAIAGGGINTGNTGTTTGTDSGLQIQTAETAGPDIAVTGTQYTVTETGSNGADLADYTSTYSCLDQANGNASLASGSGTSVTVTAPNPNGANGPNILCTFTNTAKVANLTIAKTASTALSPSGATVEPGGTVTWTLTVTNNGPDASSGFVLDDMVPAGYTGIAVTGSTIPGANAGNGYGCTVSGNAVACVEGFGSGGLAQGASASITFTAAAPATGCLDNVATVLGNEQTNGTQTSNPVQTCVGISNLQVSKAASPTSGATVNPDGTITYTLTFDNSAGTATATVNSVDDLSQVADDATVTTAPAQASGTGLTVSAITANQFTVTGSVSPGATSTVTYTVKVDNPDTGNHVLNNYLLPPSTPPPASCAVGSSTCTTHNVPAYTVQKSSSAGASVNPGATITYTLTVKNTGQVAYPASPQAQAASISDDLSDVLDDATYVAGSATAAGWTFSQIGSTLTGYGPLAVGGTATITYQVTVKNPDPVPPNSGTIKNVVTANGTGGGCATTPATCTTTTDVNQPDVTVTKSSSPVTGTAVSPGGAVTYTIHVNNGGTAPGTVDWTDAFADVADDATFTVAPAIGAAPSNGGSSLTVGPVDTTAHTFAITGTLAAGDSATVTYTVRVDDPDTGNHVLDNYVVRTGQTPPNVCLLNDPHCTSNAVPDLDVHKSVDTTTAQPGDTVHYTITAKNTGLGDFTAGDPAVITDDLSRILDDVPAGPTALAASYDGTGTPPAPTFTSPTLHWSGALPSGQTLTITFAVTVPNPDTGDKDLPNTVVSNHGNCEAGSADPNCSTDTKVPALTVSKSADPASGSTVTPGQTVTYALHFGNTAGQAPAAVDYTDDLSDVLDDAAVVTAPSSDNADLDVSAVTAGKFTVTGTLPVGATATITYSVKVNVPDAGNHVLDNYAFPSTATPPTPGSCTVGDPLCTTNPVPDLAVRKTVSSATATAGDTLTYTVTARNTGQAAFSAGTPATLTDDLTGLLDDTSDPTIVSSTYSGPAGAAPDASFASPTLRWSGPLAVGQTVTAVYTVVVDDPDTGDHDLPNTVVGNVGNCVGGSSDPDCTTDTKVPDLDVRKSVDRTTARPGDTVSYTITARNTGQVAFTRGSPATLTDDLSDVLDDATLTTGPSASYAGGGTPPAAAIAGTALSWSGPLALGQTVQVTYTVTIKANPSTGGGTTPGDLPNTVLSNVGNCVTGTDPGCTTDTTVPALVVTKTVQDTTTGTAGATSAPPGDTLKYTITVANSTDTAYPAAQFADDLTRVLDDATYDNDAAASGGTVGYTAPSLHWTGDVAANSTVTITFTVKVNQPGTGDHDLANTVVTPSGNCVSGSTDPRCSTDTKVPDLQVHKAVDRATAQPGDTVTYTITATNTGKGDFTAAAPATLTDSLAPVLDDARYDADATASAGTIAYSAPTLSWSGALAAGRTVSITYSVTVDSPDTGDHDLPNTVRSNVGNCTTPASDCTADTKVPSYALHKASDPATGSTLRPGATVTYTVTAVNTGQVSLTPTVTDDLSKVLDDAAYNGDAKVSAGPAPTLSGRTLSWTGPLAVGQTVTLTYSVTVNNPDTGDRLLDNTVVGTGPATDCTTPGDPNCTTHHHVKSPPLAYTGAGNVPLQLWVVGGLIAAGGLLLLLGRRRWSLR